MSNELMTIYITMRKLLKYKQIIRWFMAHGSCPTSMYLHIIIKLKSFLKQNVYGFNDLHKAGDVSIFITNYEST